MPEPDVAPERPESPEPSGPPEPPGPPEPSGRDRLRAAFLRPSRGQAIVAVLVALLAFAAVTQVRLAGADDSYAGLREDELVQALNGLQAASRQAERDVADLEATREELRSGTSARAAALEQAREQERTLAVLAGTVAANGPGIRVTVNDPDDALGLNQLLDGIEELRNAGVEAMEINDEVRVVASTWFEAGSEGVVVDGTELRQPYVIDAIGSPSTLSTALDFDGGFIDDVRKAGGSVQIVERDRVEVTVTLTPGRPRYAEPVPGQ